LTARGELLEWREVAEFAPARHASALRLRTRRVAGPAGRASANFFRSPGDA
jgi:hypothetical protein